MLIDWFTTGAQIINFLILVYLLKRFLYGPIIRAMDRREQRIADRLADADSIRRQAEEEKTKYRRQSDRLDREKTSILKQARQEAEKERRQMQRRIREEREEARRRWQQELARQQQTFLAELRRHAGEQILQTAARALRDLADQDLQERIARVFVTRLRQLDRKEIDTIRRTMDEEHPGVTISAAMAVAGPLKQELTGAVRDVLGGPVAVDYRVDDRLAAGLKLDSGNQVVAWNLEEYFTGLQEEIARFIGLESEAGEQEDEGRRNRDHGLH